MNVIELYASKSGSTREIAEFIADRIREQGISVEAQSVDSSPEPGKYDAVVIGSAVYMGHWVKEAVEFVQRNRTVLATRPVWLFSSGPLKPEAEIVLNDPELEPKEIAEIRSAIHPRDHRIFSGALNPGRCGFMLRVMRKLPAARAVLPEGDFRDWDAIETWAKSITRALKPQET